MFYEGVCNSNILDVDMQLVNTRVDLLEVLEALHWGQWLDLVVVQSVVVLKLFLLHAIKDGVDIRLLALQDHLGSQLCLRILLG